MNYYSELINENMTLDQAYASCVNELQIMIISQQIDDERLNELEMQKEKLLECIATEYMIEHEWNPKMCYQNLIWSKIKRD